MMNRFIKWALIASLSFALLACSDNDYVAPAEKSKNSILKALKQEEGLSQFTQTLESLDFGNLSATKFTVFALPTKLLGYEKNAGKAYSYSEEIVKRHVIIGDYTLDELKITKEITTLSGSKLPIVVDGDGKVFIHDVELKNTEAVDADGSLIYVMDDIVSAWISGDMGIAATYKTARLQILDINPEVDIVGAKYEWKVIETPKGKCDSIISIQKELQFISLHLGTYKLELNISNAAKKIINTTVEVGREENGYSAYIAKVYGYLPAVGQFTNKLPNYQEGDTQEKMIEKAGEALVGKNASMVHLGGFGGYVVFGFDHTVVNIPHRRDFRVKGNAFWANTNPNPEAPARGGSCEPGIIMVAYDKNKNGNPDHDEWYEIAGSEYYKETTIKNYEISYFKPEVEPSGATKEYIRWEDNQGNKGYKEKNAFHNQSYYPLWGKEDKITFKGTLLPDNAVDESGAGSYWVLYSYDWGYADNAPNSDDASAIDIDWAVDSEGNRVKLPGIDFVKVYTAINQEAGWLGEVSTEVSGAEDLHLLDIAIESEMK